MLEENLSEHCRKKHNAAKRIVGETSVSDMFSPAAKKSKASDSGSSSAQAELLLATGGRKTPEDNILVRPETPVEYIDPFLADYTDTERLNDLINVVRGIHITSEESKQTLKELKDDINSLAAKLQMKVPEFAKPDDVSPFDERILNLRDCRTIEQIVEVFDELVYEEDSGSLLCELCFVNKEAEGSRTPGHFKMVADDEDSEVDNENVRKNLDRKFINMKKSIKRHFKTTQHMENWEVWKKSHDEKRALVKRNHEVGMRIARICYVEYREGNSKRHFETEVLKAALNGTDLGDLNHSDQFPRKFRPFVKSEIHERTKTFFNSRLEQTGFKPALNISADKGTNVHRSRQFTTIKTCVPDSPNLISSIFLGEPVVKKHDGIGVTDSIVEEVEKFGIKPEQIEGASFDGAYFHQSVPDHMKTKLNLPDQFIATHDPLHRAGIQDTHIRKDSSNSWLTDVQEICSELYNKFNWGKNYELLLDTCKELELSLASLTKFSKTRFANSVRFVTINIRKDFQIIVKCLQKIVDENKNSSIGKDRDKAADAERILKKICTKKFVLELSGISDVYDVFGKIVNICQEVDVLPHERFDKVKAAVAELKDMVEHRDHSKCVESFKKSKDFVGDFPESGRINGHCRWPCFHLDLSDLTSQGKYRSIEKKKSFGEKSVETRLTTARRTINVTKDPLKIAETEVVSLAKQLYDDLSKELFEKDTIEVVELTRNICDLKSMGEQIKMKGSIVVGTLLAVTRSLIHFMKSLKIYSKKTSEHSLKLWKPILNLNHNKLPVKN